MKSVFFITCIFGLLFTNCKAKNTNNSTVKIVNGLQPPPNIVKDIVQLSKDAINNSSTGILVAPHTVITSLHCIKFPEANSPDKGEIYYIPANHSVKAIKSTKVFIDPDFLNRSADDPNKRWGDLAVVVFSQPIGTQLGIKKYRALASSAPQNKDPIIVAGFGREEANSNNPHPILIKRWGNNLINKMIYNQNNALVEFVVRGEAEKNSASPLGTNSGVAPGDSGSPLIRGSMQNEQAGNMGEILGIASGVSAQGIAIYTSIVNNSYANNLFNNAINCAGSINCADNFLQNGH